MKITFTGDIMCSRLQNESISKKGKAYYEIFSPVADVLKSSDYVCGNLETTVSGEDLGYTQTKDSFNTPIEFLHALKTSGFHFLSTANNHIMDRGEEGIRRTLSALGRVGFDHTGCYASKEESNQLLIKTFDDTKIAFLSYTYGTNSEYHGQLLPKEKEYMVDMLKRQAPYIKRVLPLKYRIMCFIAKMIPSVVKKQLRTLRKVPNIPLGVVDNVGDDEIENNQNVLYLNRLKEKIQRAKKHADLVVVCLHCGGQYNNEIGRYTFYIHDFLKKEGVDIVIGNHPHCVLPCQLSGNQLHTYSLGNFTFTPRDGWYIDGVLADYSILLHAYINTASQSVEKYTFSIVKNIRRSDDISQTYMLYDLIQAEEDAIKKSQLMEDNMNVIKRFTGKIITNIEKEYCLC